MNTFIRKWLAASLFAFGAMLLIFSYFFFLDRFGSFHYQNNIFPILIGSVLLLILGVMIAASCVHFQIFISALRDYSNNRFVLIFSLSIGVIAYLLTPQARNILFDENIFIGIAQTFSKSGMLASCQHGRLEDRGFACFVYEYYKQPPGFPFYLAVFFRIFGASEFLASLANLMTLPMAVVAGIVFLKDLGWSHRRSLLAMGLYVTCPLVMHWSGTAALEPFSVSSTMVALALLGRWLRSGDSWTGYAAAAAIAWAMMSRLESVLPLSAGALLLLPSYQNRHSSIRREQIVLFLSMAIFFIAPLLVHIVLFKNDPWGASRDRFSTNFFWSNLKVNGGFLFKNQDFPVWITLAAILAVFTSKQRLQVMTIVYWFVVSFSIYLFFYAGSYEYGMDARFSLPSSLPLALLAAIFLDKLADVMQVPSSILCAIPLIQLIWFAPVIRNVQLQPQAARDSILFSESYLETLPPDSIVFSHVPSVPLLHQRNAAQIHLIDHGLEYTQHFFDRYSGGVYLDWTYWCSTTEEFRKNCQRIVERFEWKVIQSMTRDRLEFKLIRLWPKKLSPDSKAVKVSLQNPRNFQR